SAGGCSVDSMRCDFLRRGGVRRASLMLEVQRICWRIFPNFPSFPSSFALPNRLHVISNMCG
ncbi:MAG TPA: hypothetical protein DC058_06890, partial [Planctomycetaceae bacterium]|nr:hypothetical protein [Planctomycetaceae bacterium]